MGFARRQGGYLLLALGLILLCPAPSAASWDPLFRGAQVFDVGTWPPASNDRHSSPSQLAAGDLNSDGRPDVVVVNRDVIGSGRGTTISVLLHSQDPSARSAFLPKASYPTLMEPMHVELADMDLDGHLDAVVRSVLDSVCVMLGTGNGSFGAPVHRAVVVGVEERVHVVEVAVAAVGEQHRVSLVLEDAAQREQGVVVRTAHDRLSGRGR